MSTIDDATPGSIDEDYDVKNTCSEFEAQGGNFSIPIKPARLPRIGLYSIGHPRYWNQFEGPLDRLLG